ncbi:hypothetical protein [uncultured Bacteroides sp.]|uniref:TlpA family protein disulfide reductase n=1 Tax=uncultured Bacteroides sp. TaxID=162156 RepID=UPI00260BF670|nr:hypothetical protein [uncultured Bacteroides sp.]
MKKFIYIIALLVGCSVDVQAQRSSLTFSAEKNCEVEIYAPIDGGYNDELCTQILLVQKGKTESCSLDIKNFGYVACNIPLINKKINVLLLPGDSVGVHIGMDGVSFSGDNAIGQQFRFNRECRDLVAESMMIEQTFNAHRQRGMSIPSIVAAMEDSLKMRETFSQIEHLSPQLKKPFPEILKEEVYMDMYPKMMAYLWYELTKEGIKEDSISVYQALNKVYDVCPVKVESVKYPLYIRYVFPYLRLKHAGEPYPAGFDGEAYGPYSYFLWTHPEMQKVLFGSAFLIQLEYNSEEMDLQKLQAYFNKEFPNSEYTRIINQKLADMGSSTVNAHFVSEKIDSLSQLSKVSSLSGKYLYVDLWASWCMPCRKEFSNKDRVEKILDKYKNIVTAYITWDTPDKEKAWKKCIDYYKLSGYHLMATESLKQHIGQLIYKGNGVEIPRYILISPQGSVLHNDLPRPSEYLQLENVLDEWMK